MINSSIMIRDRAPIKYFTQSGMVGWGGAGGDEGSWDDEDDWDDEDGWGDGARVGCDSVVKALAALQSLQVSELVALTFQ